MLSQRKVPNRQPAKSWRAEARVDGGLEAVPAQRDLRGVSAEDIAAAASDEGEAARRAESFFLTARRARSKSKPCDQRNATMFFHARSATASRSARLSD